MEIKKVDFKLGLSCDEAVDIVHRILKVPTSFKISPFIYNDWDDTGKDKPHNISITYYFDIDKDRSSHIDFTLNPKTFILELNVSHATRCNPNIYHLGEEDFKELYDLCVEKVKEFNKHNFNLFLDDLKNEES